MKLDNVQKIGTHFKKENIFLATVLASEKDAKETLKSKIDSHIQQSLLDYFVNQGVIAVEQVDVFYKNKKGYTRFVEEGSETFAGNGTDGKSKLNHIVPIWDYYSEDQVVEGYLDNEPIICVTDTSPICKYNEDYNKA